VYLIYGYSLIMSVILMIFEITITVGTVTVLG